MARAIIQGAEAAGLIDQDRVIVADPEQDTHTHFRRAVHSANEAIAWLESREESPGAGQVLLAVKPQTLRAVARELRHTSGVIDRAVVSILAGVPSGRVRAALGDRCRVVRVMPNTPARIRRGMSAIAVGEGAGEEDASFARALMSSVGEVIEIHESLMDAFTALAGSGPAYLFYLAEAMDAAAQRLGFGPEQAALIVRQTLLGAASLLGDSDERPADLRAAVTSRGGTTAAATAVLDDAGLTETMVRAIRAAKERGVELAKEAQA